MTTSYQDEFARKFFPQVESGFSPQPGGGTLNSAKVTVEDTSASQEVRQAARQAAMRILVSNDAVSTLLETRDANWVEEHVLCRPSQLAHIVPKVFQCTLKATDWIDINRAIMELCAELYVAANVKAIWSPEVRASRDTSIVIGIGPGWPKECILREQDCQILFNEPAAQALAGIQITICQSVDVRLQHKIVVGFHTSAAMPGAVLGRVSIDSNQGAVRFQHQVLFPVIGWLDWTPDQPA